VSSHCIPKAIMYYAFSEMKLVFGNYISSAMEVLLKVILPAQYELQ
jgi:hypothetical protein